MNDVYTLEYDNYTTFIDTYHILKNGLTISSIDDAFLSALCIRHDYKKYWLRGTGAITDIDAVFKLIISMSDVLGITEEYEPFSTIFISEDDVACTNELCLYLVMKWTEEGLLYE